MVAGSLAPQAAHRRPGITGRLVFVFVIHVAHALCLGAGTLILGSFVFLVKRLTTSLAPAAALAASSSSVDAAAWSTVLSAASAAAASTRSPCFLSSSVMLLTSLHLRFRDGAVHLAGFHKLAMRAQAHDLAILEHDNLVGVQNRRDAAAR